MRAGNAAVVIIGNVELVIGAEAIGVDDAVRVAFAGDYRDQRVGLGVFHPQHEDMAAALQQPKDRGLDGT